jgi:hypothetical protein
VDGADSISLRKHLKQLRKAERIAEERSQELERQHQRELRAEQDKRIDERFAAEGRAREVALAAEKNQRELALAANEKLVSAAFLSSEKAITKAEESTAAHFEESNGVRNEMSERALTFVTKDSNTAEMRALSLRVDETNGIARSAVSREEWAAGHQTMTNKIDLMSGQLERIAGRSTGVSGTWGVVAGTLGLLIALLLPILLKVWGK